ncbi:MAG: AAA family ATPase, partial [Thaumarchaeota archaeon]|nr:AAA family ATPase [Nitrososphaerota archaeon]
MIIRRIRLVNFISHKDTVIEVPRGLTAIIGSNGAGKTAILDAISYALFKEHSRGREENLINRRASSARVQLEFEANGRIYEVTWRIEKGRRALAALRNLETGSPILVDAGERTAIPEIERILGVSREVFLNAAYIRQGELARLLEARPAERKELIAKLLGIDVLERIWENLRTPIKMLEERLSKLREEAGRLEELEERLREIELELREAEKLLDSKNRQLEELAAKLEDIEGKLEKLEEEKRRVEGLKEAISRLEKLIDGKRRELETARREYEIVREAEDEAEKLEEARSEKLKLEAEVKKLESEISEIKVRKGRLELLEKRLGEMLEELESLKSQLKKAGEELRRCLGLSAIREEDLVEKLEEALGEYARMEEELRRRIEKVDGEIGALRGRREKLLNDLELLESGRGRCPLCRRPMDEEHRTRVIELIRRELLESEEKLKILEVERGELILEVERTRSTRRRLERIDPEKLGKTLSRIRELELEISKLEAEVEGLRGVDDELKKLEEELSRRKLRLKEAEEKVIELERDVGVIEKLGSSRDIKRRIDRLMSEVSELENKMSWMKRRISEAGYDEESYAALREEHSRVLKLIGDLKAEASAIGKQLENLESERKRISEELGKAMEAERKAKSLESYLKSLRRIRECFGKDGVQRYARTMAKRSIEHYAKQFLRFFSLAYSDLKLDEDYNVYVYGRFGEQSIDSLSGGEKTAIALCLRLG